MSPMFILGLSIFERTVRELYANGYSPLIRKFQALSPHLLPRVGPIQQAVEAHGVLEAFPSTPD